MPSDVDVPLFQASEERDRALSSDRLNKYVSAINWLLQQVRTLQAQLDQLKVGTLPVKMGGPIEGLAGTFKGTRFRPPIFLPEQEEDQLEEKHLGELPKEDGEADDEDVELWDASAIPGVRLAHLLGRNADGKPILILDGSTIVYGLTDGDGLSGQGGRYEGRLIIGPAKSDASGNLAASDLGDSNGEEVIFWNVEEVGQTTHVLPGSTPFVGLVVGKDKASGKKIVLGSAYLTIGTVQYQVYQMLNTTTRGWDWVRAH